MAGAAAITGATGATASFGPVLFFGLTAAALITHTDPFPLANPQETMAFGEGYEVVLPLAQPLGSVPGADAGLIMPRRPAPVPAAAPDAPSARLTRPAAPLPRSEPLNPALNGRQTATRGYGPLPFAEVPPPRRARLKAVGRPARDRVPSVMDGPYALALPAPEAASAPIIASPAEADAVAQVTFAPSLPARLAQPQTIVLAAPGVAFARVSPPTPLGLPNPTVMVTALAPTAPSSTALGKPLAMSQPFQTPEAPRGVAPLAADGPLKAKPLLIWGAVTGNAVNFRAGPGLDFESLAQFNAGARLIVTDIEDGWARVNALAPPAGPLIGWMS
ncbi:MAG: SH3 domain-containing protein, partial [Pseudomonadota bacterium]